MRIINYKEKVKAKKPHVCDYCGCMIESGDNYQKSTIVYDDMYVWKSHHRCSEIAEKLKMFDYCDEGLTRSEFQENIREWFCEIWRKKDNEYYESKDFNIPSFKDQLEFVCSHYLNN